MKYKQPENIKQLQSFLGLVGYFRKFINGFSSIGRPLSDLLKHGKKFEFNEEQIVAFRELKQRLCEKPVLEIFNPNLETEVLTDASMHGFGAVLLQKKLSDGELHPVYYMSKKTTDAEKKYCSYHLEVLAVIEALKKFRVYLLGLHFKIITDCDAFTKTLEKKDLCARVARWVLYLQEYDYTIEHRSGARLKHVDALSRAPVYNISSDSVLEKIRRSQQQNDDLKAICDILCEKPTHNDYFLKGNILYKLHNDNELIVIPPGMQHEVIKNAHEKGHFGVRKVKELLSKDFYIPHLEEKIQKQISCCVPCVIVNRKCGRQEGHLHPLDKCETPLCTYHIDFIGPLASKMYKHILVVIDSFSKFCWLYPTKTTSAANVISKFQLQSTNFGNPKQIISDRGAAFTSAEFGEYCENEGIQHYKVTTGLPRANGQVERMNAVVANVLAKAAVHEPDKWYKYVDTVQKYINSTVSRSTQFTPFELLLGVKMRLKEDSHLKEIIENELLIQFNEEREDLRTQAKQQLLKVQEENRKNYNLRRKPASTYKHGDRVTIKRTQLGGGLKLKPKYLGPYEFVAVKPNDTYDVCKVGGNEGPNRTTTCAEYIKKWPEDSFEANDS